MSLLNHCHYDKFPISSWYRRDIMVKRQIKFDYYQLTQSSMGKYLENVLIELETELKSNPKVFRNIEVSGYILRVRSIKKVNVDDKNLNRYCWIGHIEKIDTYSEAYVGDLTGNRNTYAEGDDEGPIKDSIFLYDPFINIISSHRSNTLSYMQLNSYLRNITNDDELSLEVIVDPNVISKLQNIPEIKEIEYSIAAPQKWGKMASASRDINSDLLLAQKLNAGRMKVCIGPEKGDKIDKSNALKKIKSLLPFAKQEVTVLKVKGVLSDETDTLDLIHGKFEATKYINLTKGKKLTFVQVEESIEEAYKEKFRTLNDMFISNS